MALNQKLVNSRIYIIYFSMFLFTFVLALRLFYLQVYKYNDLRSKAEKQQRRSVSIAEKRGLIIDRNSNVLAIDNQSVSLYAYPKEYNLKKFTLDDMAQQVALVIDEDVKKVRKKLSSPGFIWIKRQLSASYTDEIKKLKIPGINYVEESKRFYPKNTLASSLIGFTGIDNQGLTGIEQSFENVLTEQNKKEKIFLDALGYEVLRLNNDSPSKVSKVKTNKVKLTLDENIQYVTERELKKGIDKYKAKRGLAIVMELGTGDLLSLATNPTYNPNDSTKRNWSIIKNWAVTDFYEPGSTMKIFSIAAAIEQKVLGFNELVPCPGIIKIDNWIVHDHGSTANQVRHLSPEDIIKFSSNVGTSIISRRMSPETFRNMLLKFGFGKVTGSGLYGEVSGIVPELPWVQSRQSTISFGQGIAVTPLQLVTAMSAIARGGVRVEPRIIKEILDHNDKVIKKFHSKEERTLSKDTADKMLKLITSVVQDKEGTGNATKIPGYVIGGKTGTAQKVENGRYSHNVMSSFLGAYPVDNPKILTFVLLDSPQTAHYASMTAVPVFREIANFVLNYMNIPPSKPVELVTKR